MKVNFFSGFGTVQQNFKKKLSLERIVKIGRQKHHPKM
jgi:hypothetical protein